MSSWPAVPTSWEGWILRAAMALIILCVAGSGLSCRTSLSAKGTPPFGTPADVQYAQQLWSAMEREQLVGKDAQQNALFVGAAPPHGWILELAYQDLTVAGHTGFVVVKKNYSGQDVQAIPIEQVAVERGRYLKAITVMYRREAGYDADNQNWFWVKYRPDGNLFTKPVNSKEVALAGRIVKGKTSESSGGCIYCHRSAGGGDYIFYPQITAPARDTSDKAIENH